MNLKNLNGGTGKTKRQMNPVEIEQFAEMNKKYKNTDLVIRESFGKVKK